jgi:DNA-binding winged helix-turn-helix (wHTH) protein/TolB-like protein/Tfp pilus assembly protein PilF
MSHQPKHSYEFGSYHLNPAERLLRRDGAVVPLQPKILDLLLVLVERHGHLLEKDELMRLVWPDAIVEEANLANNISILRKTLSENGERFIETVPKRGYRFVAQVSEVREKGEELAATEPINTQTAIAAEPETNAQATSPDGYRKLAAGAPIAMRPAMWRLLAVALGVSLVAVAVISFTRRNEKRAVEIKSLAVLPFKPLATESRDEALELGMADTLIAKLSGLRQVIVRPTSAVRKYTALDQDPLAAGREQRVDAVLESSMHLAGEKLRVTVRLLDVRDGSSLWTYECAEYCADIFAAQDAISRKVAEALAVQLTGAERGRLAKRYTEKKEAYLLYQQGRYFADKRTVESNQRAIEHYKQALDLDPNYAQAWVGMADAYFMDIQLLQAKESMPRAKAAAMKALAIDETLSEAHAALARVLWQYDWDWPAAEREFKRAIELDPGNAFAHRIYGYYLASMGRVDESVAAIKKAQELDPLSLIINLDVGQMLYYAGQNDQAMAQFRKTQAIDPNFRTVYQRLGMGYCRMGKYAEAVAELERADTLAKGNSRTISLLGYAYGLWGKRDEAVKKLDELKELSGRKYVTPWETAIIYTGLGDKDQAFDWLRRACDEREPLLVYINVWPIVESLRTDPRFASLLRCVGLPQ